MNRVGGVLLQDRQDHKRSGWAKWAAAAVQIRRDPAVLILDIILVSAAYWLMLILRYEGGVPGPVWDSFQRFLPFALVVMVLTNLAAGGYGHLWRHASLYEAQRIALAGAVGMMTVTTVTVFTRHVPISVAVTGGIISTLFMGLVRFQSRLSAFRRGKTTAGESVVVVGAGDVSVRLVQEMLRAPEIGFHPVAVIDEDRSNHNKTFMGVPVRGSLEDLGDVVRATGATVAIFPETATDHELIPRLAAAAEDAGITLKILPAMSSTMRGQAAFNDIRDVNIEDLLGRPQIEIDSDAVAAMLQGKRVLITGAGGSIGSEIVRQVAGCKPTSLVLLDNDETHLFDIATEFKDQATQVLVDIRNANRVMRVFERHSPDVVIHAAAHKHVPILEEYPCEAAETNVIGTSNVLAAAQKHNVERFVAISTDKAVYPSSIMGASKRISEQLVLNSATGTNTYCAVRFGNVVGSRGSVVPTFMRQIRAGGPVTVTDERMTRFFMSIPEAVQLVLQAAALAEPGNGGDVFMLDMGSPVRIYDLAERMIRMSGARPGHDIEIAITGMRPGEKLAEKLKTLEESEHETAHPSVRRVSTSMLSAEVLDSAIKEMTTYLETDDHESCGALLRQLAGAEDPALADSVDNIAGARPNLTLVVPEQSEDVVIDLSDDSDELVELVNEGAAR